MFVKATLLGNKKSVVWSASKFHVRGSLTAIARDIQAVGFWPVITELASMTITLAGHSHGWPLKKLCCVLLVNNSDFRCQAK